MATITHSLAITGTNDAGKQVSKNAWNAPHVVELEIADVGGLQDALDDKATAAELGGYVTTAALAGELANKQPLATVLTDTTAAFTTAQETKLAGIATAATANSPDATLLARANHTGTQSVATVTGTKAQFDAAVTDGNILYVGDITQYTDELAQDAVGAMVDTSLVYVDATPLLTRAALTGDATAAQGSNAITVVKINGVALSGLATGILKNTTTTGVPSIAVAGDFPTLNQNTTGSAATLTTARNIDGQAFNGSANITVIAPGTNAAASKATPVDADELPLVDSAASNVLKKLTWANLKATLKTYFDTLYQPLSTALTTLAGLTATTDNFIVSVSSAWASRTPAQVRTTLGLVIGTNVQAYDADLDALASSGIAAAATITSPVPVASGGAFGTASSIIHATKVGKWVFFSANITITAIGTAPAEGAAGSCDVALPYASVATIYQSFGGRENGVTGKGMGATILPASTTLRFQRYDGTAMHGNGYVLTVTGVYEAA